MLLNRLKLASAEERWSERQSKAKPMLDDLNDGLISQKVIESSPLGKAIKYTLGQWPKLIRYVGDGHLSIDNNRAERAIKLLVIGKKTGFSPIILMVLMPVRCCTALSGQQKLTG